jgi:hypothetical protein
LSFIAGLLVIIFKADTHRLIPLHSVGVFVSFTLGQYGMVNHWRKEREKGWLNRAVINGSGAVVTPLIQYIKLIADAAGEDEKIKVKIILMIPVKRL